MVYGALLLERRLQAEVSGCACSGTVELAQDQIISNILCGRFLRLPRSDKCEVALRTTGASLLLFVVYLLSARSFDRRQR